MTTIIQLYSALGTTTSRAICGVNGKDYYFYACRRGLMLEIGYFSSLYAQFRLLIVAFQNHGQRIMLRRRFIFQTLKGKMLCGQTI